MQSWPLGWVCEFHFGGEGREGKGGLKSSCESILLFKSFPFPPFPLQNETYKHTLKEKEG